MRLQRIKKYRMHHSTMSIPESWKVQKQSIFGWWYTLEKYNWYSFNSGYTWEREKKAEQRAIERAEELNKNQ